MAMNFKGSPSDLKLRTEQPLVFLKDLALSPLIYLRLVGILFSIIVFGCMSNKGFASTPTERICWYNNSGACNYALAIGVLAFLICIGFIFKDVAMVVVDFSGFLVAKSGLIILDLVVNGFWCFLWFVGFCYTTDRYRSLDPAVRDAIPTSNTNCLRATITFSFFSIILWVAIIVLNVLYLFWILKGTDRDSKASSNYDQPANPENYEDEDQKEPPQGGDNYSPPEY